MARRFVFTCEFAVGQALPADLGHGQREALRVVHVLSVVETKHLLIKVAIEMKRFHADIGAMHPALHKAPEVLQCVRVYAAMHVFDSVIYDLMLVIAIESNVRLQRIGIECRASLNLLPHKRLQIVFAALRNDLCADFPAALHEPNHNCLVIVYPASELSLARFVHVPRLATDESLVNLYLTVRTTAELGTVEIILHSEPKALQHKPCRLLRDADSLVNLHTADTVLAVDQHPKCRHPFVKSKRRILKHCSQFHGELLLADVAEPDASGLNERVFGFAATRANYIAIRPAERLRKLKSAVRIGEVNNRFLECFWAVHE